MTNEELASAIRAGDTTLLSELWQQTEKYITSRAEAYHRQFCQGCSIEPCDLIQEGYIALSDACQTFEESKGFSFLTWYDFYLKRAFRNACGFRTKQGRFENAAFSLDEPLPGNCDSDSSELTLADTVPDADAAAPFEETENRIFQAELHAALDEYIDQTVTKKQAVIIRSAYFDDMPLNDIAAALQLSPSSVSNAKLKAEYRMQKQRRSAAGKSLEAFIAEYRSDHHVGTAEFMRTHMSETEAAAFKRIELTELYNSLSQYAKGENHETN